MYELNSGLNDEVGVPREYQAGCSKSVTWIGNLRSVGWKFANWMTQGTKKPLSPPDRLGQGRQRLFVNFTSRQGL